MENDKYIALGRNFYEWYNSNKVDFALSTAHRSLDSEIKRVVELIEYVKEKKRLRE